jgi:hypothetical protein
MAMQYCCAQFIALHVQIELEFSISLLRTQNVSQMTFSTPICIALPALIHARETCPVACVFCDVFGMLIVE